MLQVSALELSSRTHGERPVVVCVTRRKSSSSEESLRAVAQVAVERRVDAVSLDVDDTQNRNLIEEWRVRFVPEVLVLQRGVVLERAAGTLTVDDTRALLRSAGVG
jgi:hypothetical protein